MNQEGRQEKFIGLIDHTLFTLEEALINNPQNETLLRAKSIFLSLRSSVTNKTLPLSNGAGLGVRKGLDGAPEAVYHAAIAVEDFFRQEM